MADGWHIAIVVLWLLMMVIGFVTLSTVRHVGVISLSLRPVDRGRGPSIGMTAPAIEGRIVGRPEAYWTLRGGRGSTRLLGFFSTECGSCMEVAPHVEALRRRISTLEVVAILPGSQANAETFVNETGFSGVVVLHEDTEAFTLFNVTLTPHFVVVDGEDTMVASGTARTEGEIGLILEQAGLNPNDEVIANA